MKGKLMEMKTQGKNKTVFFFVKMKISNLDKK